MPKVNTRWWPLAVVGILIGHQAYTILHAPQSPVEHPTTFVVDSLVLFTAGDQCEAEVKTHLTAPTTAQFVGRSTRFSAAGVVHVTGTVAARNQHGAREFADWACRYHPDTDQAVVAGGRI